ncbi:plantaricin C family lantibiotic [Romboutsia lituseburensis]|uniref:plantaricin C family lantibiotic n=1 Tax=Romboutsia lituseburensis TaxID=1537 RepID=UPI0022EB39FA|nr:plantaricin C family lantibiotic [Romboutsia lituseburensis]
MNFSKRNPLLRNNMEEFNDLIGGLGEEIKEQDLGNVDGGTGTPCLSVRVTVVATASSAGCAKTSAAAVSAASAWVNDKVTAYSKCGGVWSATAECFCK